MIKVAWLFVFSIVLSSICIRRLDRLAVCIMVHATYNTLVFGAAVLSLTIPLSPGRISSHIAMAKFGGDDVPPLNEPKVKLTV